MSGTSPTNASAEPDLSVRRHILSPWIGDIEWGPECEILFPLGLPGFEQERKLIPVEVPVQRPLVYLQSTVNPGVCFLCLPVMAIDPGFEPHLSEEERNTLGLAEDREPVVGVDVLCLGFLVPSGATVKTNLRAPIIINLHRLRGMQCIRMDEGGAPGEWRLSDSGRWETECL